MASTEIGRTEERPAGFPSHRGRRSLMTRGLIILNATVNALDKPGLTKMYEYVIFSFLQMNVFDKPEKDILGAV
jgi:hypothetical protein